MRFVVGGGVLVSATARPVSHAGVPTSAVASSTAFRLLSLHGSFVETLTNTPTYTGEPRLPRVILGVVPDFASALLRAFLSVSSLIHSRLTSPLQIPLVFCRYLRAANFLAWGCRLACVYARAPLPLAGIGGRVAPRDVLWSLPHCSEVVAC